MDINKYLYEEWKKIEYDFRVLSVKNLCNSLSIINGEKAYIFEDRVRDYFLKLDDAIFVNSNQIVDKKTLKSKNIDSYEELYKVLKEDYFIQNICIDKKNLENICTKKKMQNGNLSYPTHLFNNFYKANSLWEKLMNKDSNRAYLIHNYMKYKNSLVGISQIYTDLAGALINMSIYEIQEILNKYDNFQYLYKGYWIINKEKMTIEERIELNQWKHSIVSDYSLKELIENYIVNTHNEGRILIDNIVESLETVEIIAVKSEIEDILIDLNYFEMYPKNWTIYNGEVNIGRFNLSKLWNLTYLEIEKGTKNSRDLEIFKRRIMNNETLENIGKDFDITRERVRQIEQRLYRQTRLPTCFRYIRPFYKFVKNGIENEKVLKASDLYIEESEYDLFLFIMNKYFSGEEIVKIVGDIIVYKPEYERLQEEINILNKDKKIIKLEEIPFKPGFNKKFEIYEKLLIEEFGMIKIDEKSYFYTGKRLTNEEEIYLIIYKAGSPLHHKEIPHFAEKFNFPLNTEPGRNILATMQRDNLLNRVAPGTYALKEWNIKRHIYITDLIYQVLEEANKPLYYEEILKEVRKQRVDTIKGRSVKYYLDYHEGIIFLYTKQYILADWVDNKEKLVSHGIDIERIENEDLLYKNKVILNVEERRENYIIKYRLSEASKKTSSIRISRAVEFDFNRRIVIIDKYGSFHFQSYSSETITGINRWGYVPDVGEVFYMEFINKKVARYLSKEDFKNYMSIEKNILKEAEELWEKGMEELIRNEALDEIIIDDINTKEQFIQFGLEKGYVYYETIEKLVDLGYSYMALLYELEDRKIVINY